MNTVPRNATERATPDYWAKVSLRAAVAKANRLEKELAAARVAQNEAWYAARSHFTTQECEEIVYGTEDVTL